MEALGFEMRSEASLRMLTERCGEDQRDRGEILAPDHTTQVRRPQSNGFVERLHSTLLDEHFRVLGRTKFYEGVQEMQADLHAYLVTYNTQRPHQGRGMNGRTPAHVFALCLRKTKKPKEDKMGSCLECSRPGAAGVR